MIKVEGPWKPDRFKLGVWWWGEGRGWRDVVVGQMQGIQMDCSENQEVSSAACPWGGEGGGGESEGC